MTKEAAIDKTQVDAISTAIKAGMKVVENDGIITITCPRDALNGVPGAPTQEVEQQVHQWHNNIMAGLSAVVVGEAAEKYRGGGTEKYVGSIALSSGKQTVHVDPNATRSSFKDGAPVKVVGPNVTYGTESSRSDGKVFKELRDSQRTLLEEAIAACSGKKK